MKTVHMKAARLILDREKMAKFKYGVFDPMIVDVSDIYNSSNYYGGLFSS